MSESLDFTEIHTVNFTDFKEIEIQEEIGKIDQSKKQNLKNLFEWSFLIPTN